MWGVTVRLAAPFTLGGLRELLEVAVLRREDPGPWEEAELFGVRFLQARQVAGKAVLAAELACQQEGTVAR